MTQLSQKRTAASDLGRCALMDDQRAGSSCLENRDTPLRAHNPLQTLLHFPQSQAVCQACVFCGFGSQTRIGEPQKAHD